MSQTMIHKILSGQVPVGQSVTVKGWVRTRRDSKAGLSFINVHDGSCFDPLQVIAPAELSNYADIAKLTAGCSVEAEGELVASAGKGQSVELKAAKVTIVGWVDQPDTYPIQPKPHSMEFLRSVAHLRSRTNVVGAATRVRHTLAQAIHRYFSAEGFCWIHTPIITASDCEGAGQLFRVSTLDTVNPPRHPDGKVDWSQDFFGREAYLTVSGQLSVECYCMAMSKVYTFGPTFRAENSHTKRHLAEFWMVEPEVAFADLKSNADLAEDFLKYIFKAVLTERPDDMAFFTKFINPEATKRLETFVSSSFERIDYTEAVKILMACKEPFEFPVSWGIDLQSEHERYLTEKHVGRPMVVMNYPKIPNPKEMCV
jgi:asparaginyl-tRNA synthetase